MIQIVNGKLLKVANVQVCPSIFDGVPKSCLKNPASTRRSTSSLSEVSMQNQGMRQQDADRIKDFNEFAEQVDNRIDGFNVIKNENEVGVFMTNLVHRSSIFVWLSSP